MSRDRTKSLQWLDHLLSVLRTNLAAELSATETEITDAGLTAVTLTAPSPVSAAIDYGNRPPGNAGVKMPCVWLDNPRFVATPGRGSQAVDTRLVVTLFCYFAYPGASSPSRTLPQLVRGALGFTEGVRACVERYGPTSGVGAVTWTRTEDRTDDLGEDPKGAPYSTWIRLYEMDVEARIVARQSRGL